MRILFLCMILFPVAGMAQKYSKIEEDLQRSFLSARSGDTIFIPSGEHKILRTLWMDEVENVVIRGAGMNESILDFSDQVDGAEGVKITNSSNVTLLEFTVREAKGDGIKVQETENIRFESVKAEWLGKPDKNNGAYGIYPVLCKGVYIYNSEAYGASDAGIYVGQSEDIVVTRCLAYNNVAGIEIENSERADVYDNNAWGNTGGILVFDLPDLQKKKGGQVRVYNNIVAENNLKNFAPKGNIVGKVPQGTGILVLATKDVEVFNNQVLNNRSVGMGVISYYLTELPITDEEYDPIPGNIFIHDNQFARMDKKTTMKGRFGKMLRFKLRFGKDVPHIMWDGVTDDSGTIGLCLKNNGNETFVNLDAENDFENVSRNSLPHICEGKSLDPVIINP